MECVSSKREAKDEGQAITSSSSRNASLSINKLGQSSFGFVT